MKSKCAHASTWELGEWVRSWTIGMRHDTWRMDLPFAPFFLLESLLLCRLGWHQEGPKAGLRHHIIHLLATTTTTDNPVLYAQHIRHQPSYSFSNWWNFFFKFFVGKPEFLVSRHRHRKKSFPLNICVHHTQTTNEFNLNCFTQHIKT